MGNFMAHQQNIPQSLGQRFDQAVHGSDGASFSRNLTKIGSGLVLAGIGAGLGLPIIGIAAAISGQLLAGGTALVAAGAITQPSQNMSTAPVLARGISR